MKTPILYSIRFYQRFLSFDTGLLRILSFGGPTCRFTPRCSEYTYQAVYRYGTIRGLSLGIKRILRCHPWNPGGHDPVK